MDGLRFRMAGRLASPSMGGGLPHMPFGTLIWLKAVLVRFSNAAVRDVVSEVSRARKRLGKAIQGEDI